MPYTPDPATAIFKNKHFGKIDPNAKKKNSVTPYRIFLISKKKILASYDLDSAGALYLHNLLPCTFLQMSGYMLA